MGGRAGDAHKARFALLATPVNTWEDIELLTGCRIRCPDVPERAASLDAGLKAITTNAAYVSGLEDQLAGLAKRADFTLLGRTPTWPGAEFLHDIPI